MLSARAISSTFIYCRIAIFPRRRGWRGGELTLKSLYRFYDIWDHVIDFLITHNRFYDIIKQEWIRDIEKYKLVISLNRICDISNIHLLISPYVFVISRFRICSITLFCDITNSCSFSYYTTLIARADLFLEYVILSHAFYTAKFELENGRHSHAPITVILVRFNGNYLVPVIRKSLYH